MVSRRYYKALVLIALLALFNSPILAQGKKSKPARVATPAQRLAKAKADVVAAANAHKAALEKLLALQEAEKKSLAEEVSKRKSLLELGIVSKREIEQSEREVAVVEAKIADTRKLMGETDHLIAEASAEEKLLKMGPVRIGGYQATNALIRYNGPTRWVLTDASKVQSFFISRFNRSLPISAFGQTATHNQLGFDHSNSVDVAVHPDSVEGQALISYLRSMGIPFLAFRQAVSGQATGAHIHIGYPSHRIR
jgi:hypothetical protein